MFSPQKEFSPQPLVSYTGHSSEFSIILHYSSNFCAKNSSILAGSSFSPSGLLSSTGIFPRLPPVIHKCQSGLISEVIGLIVYEMGTGIKSESFHVSRVVGGLEPIENVSVRFILFLSKYLLESPDDEHLLLLFPEPELLPMSRAGGIVNSVEASTPPPPTPTLFLNSGVLNDELSPFDQGHIM